MEIPKPEAQTKGGSSDRQPQSSERRSSKDKFVLPGDRMKRRTFIAGLGGAAALAQ
jgi:hypothetical protein